MDVNANTSMVSHNRYSGANAIAKTTDNTGIVAVEPEQRTQLEEIRDKGFGAYVEEIQARKKEELRQKILASMNLNEETLSKMSPDQRSQIEKMVSAEILKRMTAESELDNNTKNLISLHINPQPQSIDPTNIKIIASNVGLGPLLALQEAEQKADEQSGKRDDPTG